jgi:hypothetical protein
MQTNEITKENSINGKDTLKESVFEILDKGCIDQRLLLSLNGVADGHVIFVAEVANEGSPYEFPYEKIKKIKHIHGKEGQFYLAIKSLSDFCDETFWLIDDFKDEEKRESFRSKLENSEDKKLKNIYENNILRLNLITRALNALVVLLPIILEVNLKPRIGQPVDDFHEMLNLQYINELKKSLRRIWKGEEIGQKISQTEPEMYNGLNFSEIVDILETEKNRSWLLSNNVSVEKSKYSDEDIEKLDAIVCSELGPISLNIVKKILFVKEQILPLVKYFLENIERLIV